MRGKTFMGTVWKIFQELLMLFLFSMKSHIVPAGSVMCVEINFKPSGNTWTKCTKTNKPHPGPLPDVLGHNKSWIKIQGIKRHLNLDANF